MMNMKYNECVSGHIFYGEEIFIHATLVMRCDFRCFCVIPGEIHYFVTPCPVHWPFFGLIRGHIIQPINTPSRE